MNGKSKAWAMALLLGTLLLGAVGGAAVDRLLISREATAATERDRSGERDRRRDYLAWLSAELQLDAAQQEQVGAIVERHRELTSALWKETKPRFEELREQLREEIRAQLTDEQLPKYEELLQRHSERHRRR
jgi:hypothetical protein